MQLTYEVNHIGVSLFTLERSLRSFATYPNPKNYLWPTTDCKVGNGRFDKTSLVLDNSDWCRFGWCSFRWFCAPYQATSPHDEICPVTPNRYTPARITPHRQNLVESVILKYQNLSTYHWALSRVEQNIKQSKKLHKFVLDGGPPFHKFVWKKLNDFLFLLFLYSKWRTIIIMLSYVNYPKNCYSLTTCLCW